MYKKIILIILPAIMISLGVFYQYSSNQKSDITPDIRSYVKNEENYIDFLKNKVKFKFIEENKEKYSITLICEELEISRDSYYKWRKKKDIPSKYLEYRKQFYNDFGYSFL